MQRTLPPPKRSITGMSTATTVPCRSSTRRCLGSRLLHAVPDKAIKIALRPFADAKLPSPPERAPKDPAKSFAGYVQVGAIKTAGVYAVSLSSGAWLDAIQGGKPLKTVAFSGATDCDGIRKVVKFDLRAEPLLLQLSSVPADAIVLAITPAP